jgi:hypothetical protein
MFSLSFQEDTGTLPPLSACGRGSNRVSCQAILAVQGELDLLVSP